MAVVKSPKNNKCKYKWILNKSLKKSLKVRWSINKSKNNFNKYKLSTFSNFNIHEKYVISNILKKKWFCIMIFLCQQFICMLICLSIISL